MRYKYLYILFIMLTGLAACKTSFTPDQAPTVTNYLVVEGVINTGNDSTFIKLSRTVNLGVGSPLKNELKAQVSVEDNSGGVFALKELGSGSYACAPLNVSNTNTYRLRIKTSDGKTYLSDYTPAKVTPPIDTLMWQATDKGLQINVNAHDATNATRYYRWDFTEAWEFHPNYNSLYVSDGFAINPRTPAQLVWDCFTNDVSSAIILNSTAQLSQDVVSNANIATLLSTDERISVKYTINVRQYALTVDAYNYWTALKRNTEQLGSIFDAQPSKSIGNITCLTNPAEPVIGYVTAGTVASKRIFITRTQLPLSWVTIPAYPDCQADSIWHKSRPAPQYADPTEDQYINFKSGSFLLKSLQQIPIQPFTWGNTTYTGYLSAPAICVDCTLRGSKTPPPFWK